jgi:hypothetical protein
MIVCPFIKKKNNFEDFDYESFNIAPAITVLCLVNILMSNVRNVLFLITQGSGGWFFILI